MIRLPYLHRHRATPLKAVVEKTAIESGFSAAEVVHVMSYFLTAIADEVAKGRCIAIPGFGMFLQTRGHSPSRRHRFRPNFYPAKAFKQQVRLGTHPTPDQVRVASNYQTNNARTNDKGERTFDILARFRELVSRQVRR